MKLLYLHGTRIDDESANVIQVFNMCEAFAQNKVKVSLAIAAPSNNSSDPYSIAKKQLSHDPNFKIIPYKKFSPFGRLEILGSYIGAQRVLKREKKIDICFVRDPLLLSLSINAGIPTIFESHNYLLHNRSKTLANFWEKNLLKNAQNLKLKKFITISQALADFWLKKNVPHHKILALHDGFNSGTFEKTISREEARKKIGLPIGKKIVVYAGRLYPDREPERIIYFAEKFKTVLFIVIGGPDDQKNELVRKTERLNVKNIEWKGQIPHSDVNDYLFAADVLLMMWSSRVPTIKYFSSLKMFEYMASGRIIVGEAYPTVKEVLTDGVSAYLAEPDSYDSLIGKLDTALQKDYPSAIANMASNLAFKEYSWNIRARKIISSLNDLNSQQ